MSEAISIEQLLNMIREEMKKIEYHEVYYRLKQYKVKNFRPITVEIVRCAIALERLGLPVTTSLIVDTLHVQYVSVLTICHALGDKHVLLLKRKDSGKPLEWKVHPAFMKWFQDTCSENELPMDEIEKKATEMIRKTTSVDMNKLIGNEES